MAAPEPDPREQAARAYLREQLGDRAPANLIIRATFSETPLQGEGTASLFSFTLPQISAASICAAPGDKSDHYVVAGETTPNYFPTYDLDPDDGYSLHIGTRFMLEIGIGRIAEDHEPAGARDAMRRAVQDALPNTAIENESLAGLFRGQEQTYAVYRLRLGGQDVYFMGGDCPPGFYRLTQWPPQVALRLHLGKLIRAERPDA